MGLNVTNRWPMKKINKIFRFSYYHSGSGHNGHDHSHDNVSFSSIAKYRLIDFSFFTIYMYVVPLGLNININVDYDDLDRVTPRLHCFICNHRAGVSIRNAVPIFNEQISISKNRLPKTISSILDRCLLEKKVHSSIICKKCYKLCEEYNEAQLRLSQIRNTLKDQFRKTLLIHNLDFDTAYEKSDCTDATNDLGGTVVKQNEQLVANNMDQGKKLNLPLAGAKISPLPPNVLFVYKDKELAIQKKGGKMPAIAQISPEAPLNVKKTLSIPEPSKRKLKTLKTNSQKCQKLDNKANRTPEPEARFLEKTSILDKLAQELPDADTRGVSEEINSEADYEVTEVIPNADLESSDESDEMHSELGKEGEITEDTEDNLEVEEDSSMKSESGDESEEEVVDSVVGQDAPTVVYDGVDSIVQRNGSLFSCVLCLNAAKQGEGQEKSLPKANIFKIEEDSTPEGLPQNGAAENQTGEEPEPKSAMLGDAKSIMQHIRAAHDARVFICELCGDIMRKKMDFLSHMEECHASDDNHDDGKQTRPFACHLCSRKYTSSNWLKEHMNIHKGIRPYSCKVCGKTFASKYTYQAHMKTHTDRPRPYACQQCPKAFFTMQILTQHEKTHSEIKNFFCKVCGKAFGTQHNLEVHGVVHSGFKPFVCGTCGKAFTRRANLRDHERTHTGNVFGTQHDLEVHGVVHSGVEPIVCRTCGKGFTRRAYLQVHERTHTGERPFPCDICGVTFSQRSNLQSHKRATHFDDKRHRCPHCNKKFKRGRLLEYHIRAWHTGERPYKCDICTAAFVSPENFKKHRRIHSGVKSSVCEVSTPAQ